MAEELQKVNYRDKPLGATTRQDAWKHGRFLRMVRIILTDGNGRVLLQKRSRDALSYPSRWTDAATGHVEIDENYVDAAHRELLEELGIDVALTFIGKFRLDETSDPAKKKNTFNAVFLGIVSPTARLDLERNAVAGVRWLTVDELCSRAEAEPNDLTPGLIETARRFLANDSLPTYVHPHADRWGS
jgi:isopentenyl-diphosphate delta-isomerase